MKVIIAGSRPPKEARNSPSALRQWYEQHRNVVDQAVAESGFKDISEVVSGKAKGFDFLGEAWAAEHHIPVKEFFADWASWGRSGGVIRNKAMARYADALIAINYGTPGTRNMIREMRDLLKPVHVMDLSFFLSNRVQEGRSARIH